VEVAVGVDVLVGDVSEVAVGVADAESVDVGVADAESVDVGVAVSPESVAVGVDDS